MAKMPKLAKQFKMLDNSEHWKCILLSCCHHMVIYFLETGIVYDRRGVGVWVGIDEEIEYRGQINP